MRTHETGTHARTSITNYTLVLQRLRVGESESAQHSSAVLAVAAREVQFTRLACAPPSVENGHNQKPEKAQEHMQQGWALNFKRRAHR